MRVGAHPALARRDASSSDSGARPAVVVEELLGPVAPQPLLELRRCSGLVRTSASGTWWARQVPSTGSPSTIFGPVQPFGVRSTIIGQRGRAACGRPPSGRACCWIARISAIALVQRRGHRLVHRGRVVAGRRISGS